MYSFSLKVEACPHCGEESARLLIDPPARSPEVDPAPAPNPVPEPVASGPARRAVLNHDAGWNLRLSETGRQIRNVEVDGDVRPEFLVGSALGWFWERVRTADRPLLVWPEPSRELEHLKVRQADADRAAVAPLPQVRLRGPEQPGTSPLELHPGPLIKTAAEIERLAVKKDDQWAWSQLANGYRVHALRAPLEAAMKDVGIERMVALVRTVPESDGWTWDPDLITWLGGEEDDIEVRKSRPRPDRPWSPDDYGIADW